MIASPTKRRPNVVALPRAPRTNVRAPLDPIIGRENVIERFVRAVDSGARLVTVLGPPGIGKTRLALRLLELREPAYVSGGGALFCDLSEVTDARGLVHAVASLWPPLESSELAADLEVRVSQHLSALGPTLLALDNFEQLVHTAPVIRTWCQAAPELVVIVTSRERLAVEGEMVLELPPLACPAKGDGAEHVFASEAVRLFTDRAAAVGGAPGADAEVVGALVRRLEGIPLAIELAAARTRLLPPSELIQRLEERFELLARTERKGRHATLASAIDWSWNLLSEDEQTALAECSVFSGGFTISAAEVVLSPARASTIVECVAALRDKSLIHLANDHRLALYVSIRAYAANKLEERGAPVAHAVRRRHARHYADAVRAFNVARTFQGAAPDNELRAQLTRDRENLAAALGFVRQDGSDPERPTDVALIGEIALGLTLLQGTPADVCLEALGEALAALGPGPSHNWRLKAGMLLSRQSLFNASGQPDASKRDMEELLAIPELPPGMRALALAWKGVQLRYQSEHRLAWEIHQEAARVLEALDLPRIVALNTACMGRLLHDLGDFDGARKTNEDARRVARSIGDRWMEALPIANLALVEQELGHLPAALELLQEALARFRDASEPQYEAIYMAALGDLYFELERPQEARRAYALAASYLGGWVAHRNVATLFAAWGALDATNAGQEDGGAAEAHFVRARQAARRGENPMVQLYIDLAEGLYEFARARKSGDVTRIAAELARAQSRLAEAATNGTLAHEAARKSFDVRFMLRMVMRAVQASSSPPLHGALTIANNGAWFQIREARRVDLSRRGSLRRILVALLEARHQKPDTALPHDVLVAEGWPGERLVAEAAGTRLRVAIATLRRLGLRDILLTRDDGYLLDPEAPISSEPKL